MESSNNASHMQWAANAHSTTPQRSVLGDVSPNVRKTSPAAALLTRKPLIGSPLKRTYNATLESGEGLTYLKRRKLSDDEVLSKVATADGRPRTGQQQRSVLEIGPLLPNHDRTDVSEEQIIVQSPTEPNTPSDDEDAQRSSTQNSSAERKSFSSLINYDPSSQTQNSALGGVSKAEMLRLRLRVAMYKVRTNQTDIPFDRLRVESKPGAPSRHEAVEEAMATLRRESQLALTAKQQPGSAPRLLPGPTLRPTAYSSRMIYESNLGSSPPAAGSPVRLPVAATSMNMTPQRGGKLQFGTPGTTERLHGGPSEMELTSSVVKGRVAEGLLGLRNAM